MISAVDVIESKPKTSMAKSFGDAQPVHECPSKRRLANSGQAMDQDAGRLAAHRALQLQQCAIPTCEGILGVEFCILRQIEAARVCRRWQEAPIRSTERKLELFLLVDYRYEPVSQLHVRRDPAALRMRTHCQAALACGLRNRTRLKQCFVERWQEFLGSPNVQRVRHGNHSANTASQHGAGDARKRVNCAVIDHRGLASVKHHNGYGMPA